MDDVADTGLRREKSSKHLKWSELSINSIKEEVSSDEEDEEEDEDDEMTLEEKQSMYNVVRLGDIDRLEDLLEKRNGDIRMIRFNENLLMTAIRFDQEEMCEFLLDNGVDANHSLVLIGNPEAGISCTKQYSYTCRQMSYDHQLFDIVEIIDIYNNQLFPGVKPRPRIPRYRREKPLTPSPDISDLPAQESDSSINKIDNQKPDKVKRKTKKLMKRVSSNLISLLDESDDSDDGDKKRPSNRQHSGKAFGKRGSFPPGVDPNKSKSNSTKSTSIISTDRDSGIYSAGASGGTERSISQKSQTKMEKSVKNPKSKKLDILRSTTDLPQIVCKIDTIENTTCNLDGERDVPNRPTLQKNNNSGSFPNNNNIIFGKVARARRPHSPFQYVTDHSRCRTLGWIQEPNPRNLKKVDCHGSYGKESTLWSPKVRNIHSAGSYRNLRATKSENCCQSKFRSCKDTFNGLSKYVINYRPLTKRKVEPNFRKGYATLEFVFDLN